MDLADLHLLQRRHHCTVVYTWLQFFSLILSIVAVGLVLGIYVIWPIEGIKYAEWAPLFTRILLALALAVDVVTWLYRKKLIKRGADTRQVQPYKVELNFPDRDALCQQIGKHIEIQTMFPSVLHGYRHVFSFRHGLRDIRLFVFDMQEYHKRSYSNLKQKAARHAIKKHGMKTELSRDEAHRALRINLLLLENFSEDAYKSVEVNAVYGMQYAQGVLNAIVDLSEMSLYIPAYWGTWYGGSALYSVGVKQLLKWLDAACVKGTVLLTHKE